MKTPLDAASYAEVIGDPIAQSKSPLVHGFWLERLGLPGSYRKTHVLPADLPDFIAARRADPDWRGCNVTLPHKQAVIPLIDRLDPLAAKIGAVNTIVPEDGALVGYNTDAPGFLEPLAGPLAERHLLRTARIFGTGGAARAIAYGLAAQGFAIILIGRDVAAASALAAELDAETHVAALADFAQPLTFDWGESGERLDLVVNATSLGMAGKPPLPLHLSHLPPGAIVYDAVYAPLETPLLAAARAAGHPVVDGLAMLIGQARLAFRHFFGADAPADAGADDALRLILTQ